MARHSAEHHIRSIAADQDLFPVDKLAFDLVLQDRLFSGRELLS
jgi:hypothetical protein